MNSNPYNQISNNKNNINNSKVFSKIGNDIIDFKNGILINNEKLKINKENLSAQKKIENYRIHTEL